MIATDKSKAQKAIPLFLMLLASRKANLSKMCWPFLFLSPFSWVFIYSGRCFYMWRAPRRQDCSLRPKLPRSSTFSNISQFLHIHTYSHTYTYTYTYTYTDAYAYVYAYAYIYIRMYVRTYVRTTAR